MSCCGSQRAAQRTQMQRVHAATPAPAVPPVMQAPVRLSYRGGGPTVARGPQTGLTYLFGPRDTTLEVDGRDAQALLASGRFIEAEA
jgi:hypothetical protein